MKKKGRVKAVAMHPICLKSTKDYIIEKEIGWANEAREATKVYIGVNQDGYIFGVPNAVAFQKELLGSQSNSLIRRKVEVFSSSNAEENIFYREEVPSEVANKPENLILRNRTKEARRVMQALGYDERHIREMFETYQNQDVIRRYLVITIPGRQDVEVGERILRTYGRKLEEISHQELTLMVTRGNVRMAGAMPTESVRLQNLSKELLEQLRRRLTELQGEGLIDPELGEVSGLSQGAMLAKLGFYSPITDTVNRAGVALFFPEPELVNGGGRIKIFSMGENLKVIHGPLTVAVKRTLDFLYEQLDPQFLNLWEKGLGDVFRTILYISYVQKEMGEDIQVFLDGTYLQVSYGIPYVCEMRGDDVSFETYDMDKTLFRGLCMMEKVPFANVSQFCKEKEMPLPYLTDSTNNRRKKTITISYPLGLALEAEPMARMHAQCLHQFVTTWSFPGLWN